MKASEQTVQQIERFLRKIAQKFPACPNTTILTDIHVRVAQDSGELLAFNDNDEEITRCVVEQWIDNKDERFYDSVTLTMRAVLKKYHELVDNLGILKPFCFVLDDDDKNSFAELYLADDDTVIVGGDLMQGLDKDLDDFFGHLMEE